MTDVKLTNIGFYTLANTKYADYFPRYFAEYHKPGTGPEQCQNCRVYGYIDGIFVGYCISCYLEYKGYRGIGFTGENVINEYTTNKNFFLRKVTFVPSDTIITRLKMLKLWKVLGVMGILGIFMVWLWFKK